MRSEMQNPMSDEMFRELIDAMIVSDIERMRTLVKLIQDAGIDINTPLYQQKRTAFVFAAVEGRNPECMQVLLDAGADVNAKDIFEWSALHYVAESRNLDKMKFLLFAGAKVNAVGKHGQTPLHNAVIARNLGMVKYLIEQGANKDTVDNEGQNALHLAAARGYYDIVEYLVEEGKVDINAVDKYGRNALRLAAARGKYDIVKCLVDGGADINVCDPHGMSILHHYIQCGDVKMVKYLGKVMLEKGINPNDIKGPNGESLLHFIIDKVQDNTTRRILVKFAITKLKIDRMLTDSSGKIALHYAVESGDSVLAEYLTIVPHEFQNLKGVENIEEGHDNNLLIFQFQQTMKMASMIQGLIIKKMNDAQKKMINAQNKEGNTPLHDAVINSQDKMSYVLLKVPQIDINIKNQQGKTAADYNAELCSRDPKASDTLISKLLVEKASAMVQAPDFSQSLKLDLMRSNIMHSMYNMQIKDLRKK